MTNKIMGQSRKHVGAAALYILVAYLVTACGLKEVKNYGQRGSSEEENLDRDKRQGPQDRKSKQSSHSNPTFKKKNVIPPYQIDSTYSFGCIQGVPIVETSAPRIVEQLKQPINKSLPKEDKQAREYFEAHHELRSSHERVQTFLLETDQIGKVQKFCLEQLGQEIDDEKQLGTSKLEKMLGCLKQKVNPFLCENKKCPNNKACRFYDTVSIDYGVEPWSCLCSDCRAIDAEEKSVIRDTQLEIPIAIILDYARVWEGEDIPAKNFIEYLVLLEIEYANARNGYSEVTLRKQQELTTKEEDFYSKSHRPHQYIPFAIPGFQSKLSKLRDLARNVDYRENRATYCEHEAAEKEFEEVFQYICLYEINRLLSEKNEEYLMTMELLLLLKKMRSEKLMEIMFLRKESIKKVLLTLSLFARELPFPIMKICLSAINGCSAEERWIENFDDILKGCKFGNGESTARSLINGALDLIISIEGLEDRLVSDLDPIKLSILCDSFSFKSNRYAKGGMLRFLESTHNLIKPNIHPSDFANVVRTYVDCSVDFGLLEIIKAKHESIKFEHLFEIFRCRYPRIIVALISAGVFEMSPEELSSFYHNLELQKNFLENYNKYSPESEYVSRAIEEAIQVAKNRLDKVDEKKLIVGTESKIFEGISYRESCTDDVRKIGSIVRPSKGKARSEIVPQLSSRKSLPRTEKSDTNNTSKKETILLKKISETKPFTRKRESEEG